MQKVLESPFSLNPNAAISTQKIAMRVSLNSEVKFFMVAGAYRA